MKRISIVGFGKIGQALAAHILQHNLSVTAIDINPNLPKIFEEEKYQTNEPGLQDILTQSYGQGALQITDKVSTIAGSDAVIVAIPLLVGKEKAIQDGPFLDCFKSLAPFFEHKMPVIIETSIPVGYGRNTVVPFIEQQGKKHGIDFLLAHSPERIKSGTMLQQLVSTPKVIGGVSPEATEKARVVYEWFFDRKLLHAVGSIEEAELVKLAGMVYRDINIALSNQLAQFANKKGINFSDLIPLINTDGEAHLLLPGIGVGGHCTPVYPYFLIENFQSAGLQFDLAIRARQINDSMASYAVSLLKDRVFHKRALILGLSFRPNVKEDTFSTTYLLHEALTAEGFWVSVHDSEFSADELASRHLEPETDIYAKGYEVVLLVTAHRQYQAIDFFQLYQSGCRIFVDGRNVFDRSKVEAAGIRYIGIGK